MLLERSGMTKLLEVILDRLLERSHSFDGGMTKLLEVILDRLLERSHSFDGGTSYLTCTV